TAHPQALAADHLLAVVRSFTAYYQMRFSDLSSQEQAIVEQITVAPRELSPTELGRALERSASHTSQVARRLVEAGVLLSRSEGRSTWYRLAEPLFRHWHEYRTAPWDQARASLVARLLEAVLSPEELVAAWWDNPDIRVRRAAVEAIGRDWKRLWAAWQRIFGELVPRPLPGDRDRRLELVSRAAELDPDPLMVGMLASEIQRRQWDLAAEVRPILQRAKLDVVLACWDFRDQVGGGTYPRDALRHLLPRLARLAKQDTRMLGDVWSIALEAVLRSLRQVEQRGQPWRLRVRERSQLARLPAFRSAFLLRGKRLGDQPLLDPGDLLGVGLRRPLPDGAELLVASARRRDPTLFEVVARALDTDGLPAWRVPAAPSPGQPCPSAVEILAVVLIGALQGVSVPQNLPAIVLTWSASFSHLSDPTWETLLSAVSVSQEPVEPLAGRLLSTMVGVDERLSNFLGGSRPCLVGAGGGGDGGSGRVIVPCAPGSSYLRSRDVARSTASAAASETGPRQPASRR
ncbi:MAG: helix-turn-helix transcriptional regulator, partial [Oligoflexia bacterium]|nr:helix-turn-helix transcriptional regulator [Oligoflexia bacterium]